MSPSVLLDALSPVSPTFLFLVSSFLRLILSLRWITNGVFADYFTVAVRTGGAGMAGISMLLIEKTMPGTTTKREGEREERELESERGIAERERDQGERQREREREEEERRRRERETKQNRTVSDAVSLQA